MKEKLDLVDAIEKTKLRGKSVYRMDVFPTKQEILALFDVAKYLEPYRRTGGLNLLPGKLMASLAFEPSTRTILGYEASMHRLGGSVIENRTPHLTSRIASGESLQDTLKILSKYVHVISMRHNDANVALDAVKFAEVPVLSGGFGGTEHVPQTCSDLYTVWRVLGRIEGLTFLMHAPDVRESRVAHSFALGLAKFNARIVFATEKFGRLQKEFVDRIRELGGDFKEVLDPSPDDIDRLINESDVVYLPGWIREIEHEKESERHAFSEKYRHYRLEMQQLENVKKQRGKTIYYMHPGVRADSELDFRIADTEHELYWDQVEYSLPVRMALVLSVLYGT